MSLRIATRADIPRLLAIMRDPDVRPNIGCVEQDDDWLAVTLAQRFDRFTFLIRDDEAGFFQLERMGDGMCPDVFVHAAALRGARGSTFRDNAREVERMLASLGIERVWGFTERENRRARLFAYSCGMAPCERPGDWCAWLYDPEDGQWMRKDVRTWVPQPV